MGGAVRRGCPKLPGKERGGGESVSGVGRGSLSKGIKHWGSTELRKQGRGVGKVRGKVSLWGEVGSRNSRGGPGGRNVRVNGGNNIAFQKGGWGRNSSQFQRDTIEGKAFGLQ